MNLMIRIPCITSVRTFSLPSTAVFLIFLYFLRYLITSRVVGPSMIIHSTPIAPAVPSCRMTIGTASVNVNGTRQSRLSWVCASK